MSAKSSASRGRSSSKGKGATGPKLRHTYLEMVQVAIITLNERGGSTRQEIWKCIEAKFPEANLHSYMIALKKLATADGPVIHGKNRARFTLEKKFRVKAVQRMAKGLPIKAVLMSTAMIDKVKKAIKAKKPKKDAKKNKKSGKASQGKNRKSAAKGKGKGKSAAVNKSTKDKIKEKKKQNKKTGSSKDTKAKVDQKRAKGDKKVAASTKANTNKAKKEKDTKAKSKTPAASKRQSKAAEGKKQPPKSNR